MSVQHTELIQALHDCVAKCNHCFDSCLKEDHVDMMAKCIRLDRECADICALLEQSLSRDSQFVSDLASLCAKVCRACGEECEKHDHDHCQECAKACFKCAELCESFA